MDTDLSLDFLRVVEQAAIACAHTMGLGDRHKSDQVAVEAMRQCMDSVPIDGTIVIVALPRLQAELNLSDAGKSWVITAYVLTFGGLLLLGGRVGDAIGRKRSQCAARALSQACVARALWRTAPAVDLGD